MYITVFNIPYQRNSLLNVCVLKVERVVRCGTGKAAVRRRVCPTEHGPGCTLSRVQLNWAGLCFSMNQPMPLRMEVL